ncbi:DUF4192 domain-containing protein [Modestobacter roseus]|uniref:Uncharacterized protein DUF4192 n=1 Tax=Modestobacter roseus TaxID=1181884 RepID=A0A562IRZ8_9ACTN|nr:DUF4192 domain-containing protein [Modestobacter roseus]MQA31964.1 DUF4192 family protein [Modestobacter roseus]TWH73505.1 uncharacterized protein DUF4192 [Modestobacter roseus]
MPAAERPITVRISDPGDVAAALPHLVGFHPAESLVVVGLTGSPARAVRVTARVDLPAPEDREEAVQRLVRSLLRDEVSAVVVAVVTDADDDAGTLLPQLELVHRAVQGFTDVGIAVADVLLVRRGRWWSYERPDPTGTPVPADTPLAAAGAVTGQVVAPDRAALVRRLAPVGFLAAEGMSRSCEEVGQVMARRLLGTAWEEVAEESWALLRAAVDRSGPGSTARLPDADVARLAWGLRDVDVRDRAMGLCAGPSAAGAEVVFTELTRRAPAPLDAAPATLLAVTAWARGAGALANVALDRALSSEPTYRLAVLLRQALDACLPPAAIRDLVREAAAGPPVATRARSAAPAWWPW